MATADLRLAITAGDTNLDAVALDAGDRIVARVKMPRGRDAEADLQAAVRHVTRDGGVGAARISRAMLGSRAPLEAVVARRDLCRTAVVRIGAPLTAAVPPLSTWPADLREAVSAGEAIIGGGARFDGHAGAPLDTDALAAFLAGIAGDAQTVAVTSIFSPVAPEHELAAADVAVIGEYRLEPGDRPIAQRIRRLDARAGRGRFVEVCVDLLGGAERTAYVPELALPHGPRLGAGRPHAGPVGLEGLLGAHLGRARAAPLLARLRDGRCGDGAGGRACHRPAEMCLKVSATHDVAGAGPGAAALTRHELPRVRSAALRTLGVVGDSEHLEPVRDLLDDPDESVRRHAARAYERMAARFDLPLVDALDNG